MAELALEVRGLSVDYGAVHAVRDVDLVVRRGTVVTLVGPNGAGKSSALRAIAGLERHRGSVMLDGRDVSRWKAHRISGAGFAQVPQGRRLFPELTVRENLLVGAWRLPRATREDGLKRAYETFPRLRERLATPAGSLSGGEQQMVAIARALMRAPSLLAMDEPSFGLAPILVQEVFDALSALRGTGVSILLVEQNATQAFEVSDEVYVLNGGRVVYADERAAAAREFDVVSAYLR